MKISLLRLKNMIWWILFAFNMETAGIFFYIFNLRINQKMKMRQCKSSFVLSLCMFFLSLSIHLDLYENNNNNSNLGNTLSSLLMSDWQCQFDTHTHLFQKTNFPFIGFLWYSFSLCFVFVAHMFTAQQNSTQTNYKIDVRYSHSDTYEC